jgi:hypothetical protein
VKRRIRNPINVAGHGELGFLPDLYPRETGTLALSRPNGSELRLHRTERGLWELLDWHQGVTWDGGRRWVGAVVGTLAAEEWVACGAAMAEGPVA